MIALQRLTVSELQLDPVLLRFVYQAARQASEEVRFNCVRISKRLWYMGDSYARELPGELLEDGHVLV
jgi:hypothetical protein